MVFTSTAPTDAGNSYLTAEGVDADPESPLHQLLGSSITYPIAVGPQQGHKVLTLQTLPDCGNDQFAPRVGNVAGFSLHAGVAARAHERDQLDDKAVSSSTGLLPECRAPPLTELFV